ncbi:hypothetical protein K8Z61_13005 [Nocardioides sp. TRM66260-LWL]|uniref:hypothetical protein n=1 Tax=Nocardioides sp. TRM66260-LWL TaxID=2874478 RepID=UPI001CC5390F|nr:hypothetical protein [Nocardioides sp. TRM66260-LWL]MBZ5735417.1 hypothetical protein [Nocardioides sp. TRM66260-LWL]
MTAPVVATVWWQAPHEETYRRYMTEHDALVFGRAGDASVRFGYGADLSRTVPRHWGELAWTRGRLLVQNLHERLGFMVRPEDGSSMPAMIVPPQSAVSPPMPRFDIVAVAPADDLFEAREFTLSVLTAQQRRLRAPSSEPEDSPEVLSTVPFRLTELQRRIGRLLIAATHSGGTRRPSYVEIADELHYSVRRVREVIAEMDAQFTVSGLVVLDGGDAIDRTAQVVRTHTGLVA